MALIFRGRQRLLSSNAVYLTVFAAKFAFRSLHCSDPPLTYTAHNGHSAPEMRRGAASLKLAFRQSAEVGGTERRKN